MNVNTQDLQKAVATLSGNLSGYGEVYADAARATVSLAGSADLSDLLTVGSNLLIAAVQIVNGNFTQAVANVASAAGLVPIVGQFLSAFSAGYEWIKADKDQKEARFVSWCGSRRGGPFVRDGRLPADIVNGWMGDVFKGLEEPDYSGGELARWVRKRQDGGNPKVLPKEKREALRTLRLAIKADEYAGGAALGPIYFDALYAARRTVGYTLWRALAIKSDRESPRYTERSWALAYTKGEGSLYMSEMSAAAEEFPPCDYVTGRRVEQCVNFVEAWGAKVNPKYPAEKKELDGQSEKLRESLAIVYRAARQRPDLFQRVKVRA